MANQSLSAHTIVIRPSKRSWQGGAWKVAYADFVTAMMAFFLMLWLIAAADEATLDGIAEYFTPTIGIRDSMGIGFEGGERPEQEGTKRDDLTPPGVVVGQVPQGPVVDEPKRKALMEGEEESNLFEKAEEAMKRAFEADPNLRDLSDNVIFEQSPEGLKIEVIDDDKYPMFLPGTPTLTDFGKRTLSKMLVTIKVMPNFISLTGHTDANPTGNKDYTNWELSIERANAARRFLLSEGMAEERTSKVIGRAATDPRIPEQPKDARNRRITIILLRQAYMDLDDWRLPAARELLDLQANRSGEETRKVIENVEKKAIEESKPTTEKLPEFYRDRDLKEVPIAIPGQESQKPTINHPSGELIPDSSGAPPAAAPVAPPNSGLSVPTDGSAKPPVRLLEEPTKAAPFIDQSVGSGRAIEVIKPVEKKPAAEPKVDVETEGSAKPPGALLEEPTKAAPFIDENAH